MARRTQHRRRRDITARQRHTETVRKGVERAGPGLPFRLVRKRQSVWGDFVSTKRPLVLTILDGWGYRPETNANAIALAGKPTYDKLLREVPNPLLHASDHFVGLPDGQMGNSEVGHLNIGAGRVVRMDITRIDALIAADEFTNFPAIAKAMHKAREAERS